MLVGMALAWVRRPWVPGLSESNLTATRIRMDWASGACLGTLPVFFGSIEGEGAFLDRGGFLAISGATPPVVIPALTASDSRLAPCLGLPLLRSIGLRSFALYLWHSAGSVFIALAHSGARFLAACDSQALGDLVVGPCRQVLQHIHLSTRPPHLHPSDLCRVAQAEVDCLPTRATDRRCTGEDLPVLGERTVGHRQGQFCTDPLKVGDDSDQLEANPVAQTLTAVAQE